MNIAFCINRLALLGLGVTVSSLLDNCTDSNKLHLWFLCSDLKAKDKAHIQWLLNAKSFKGKYTFVDFDSFKTFGRYRSLHGDWTPYGRLLLPDIIKTGRVLYLDADLVVEADLFTVSEFNFNGSPMAAVEDGTLKTALEKDFFIKKLGLPPALSTFNSGVIFIDIDEWHKQNIKSQWTAIAEQHSNELLSCDQALLNAIFAGKFAKLPRSFNCPWYPEKARPAFGNRMILHFVGSPKPWDLFGSLIHNGYPAWQKYLHPEWMRAIGRFSYREFHRTWSIRRSYMRVISNKMQRSAPS